MVDTLAPPTMAATGRSGVSERLVQRLELGLHGAARIGRQEMRDRLDRGVRAVRDREGVVDIDIAELRQASAAKSGSFFSSPLMEAGVLQTENVAVLHRGDRGFGDLADAIVGESHRPADDARDRGDHRLAAISSDRAPLGRPKCDSRITLPPLSAISVMVGAISLDAGGVGDLAVVHRHVEIDAHEDALCP